MLMTDTRQNVKDTQSHLSSMVSDYLFVVYPKLAEKYPLYMESDFHFCHAYNPDVSHPIDMLVDGTWCDDNIDEGEWLFYLTTEQDKTMVDQIQIHFKNYEAYISFKLARL